jgi:polyhydroxybutyrate depolymerase
VKRSLAEVVVLTAIVSACSSDHVLGGVEPGPSSPEASPDAGAPVTCDVGDWPTTPGPHDRTLTHQGVQRSYQVQIPSTYDPCKPSPVVVVLRGEGAFLAPDMTNGLTLFLNSAEARGYVALVPEATQVGLRVEWNAPLSSKKVQGVDDVGFIAAMLGETVGRDSARTHLAGHSAGGTFAHTLAASLPVFAAVLIVGGALGGRSPLSGALDIPPTPQSPVSVLLVHGRDDAIVPIDGGVVDGSLVLGLTAAETFWKTADSCPDEPAISKEGRVSTRAYLCPDNHQVTTVALDGIGHWWPEDATDLRYMTSEAAFDFFDRHTL